MAVICKIPRRPNIPPMVIMYRWNVYECDYDIIDYELYRAGFETTGGYPPGSTEFESFTKKSFYKVSASEENNGPATSDDGSYYQLEWAKSKAEFESNSSDYVPPIGVEQDNLITFELDGGYYAYDKTAGTALDDDVYSEGDLSFGEGDLVNIFTNPSGSYYKIFILDKLKRGNTLVNIVDSEYPDPYPADNYQLNEAEDKYYWYVRIE